MKKYIKKATAALGNIVPCKVRAVEVSSVSDSALLDGHLALVTGGSSGIGFSIAQQLLSAGCRVVISGRDQGRLNDAVRRLSSKDVRSISMDVTDPNDVNDKVLAATTLFGEFACFDILVNSAGVWRGTRFPRTTQEDYDLVLDTNLKGTYFVSQAVAQLMIDRHVRGHILNISSSSAMRPAWSPYQISKWGIKGLTLGMSDMLIKYGIVVNALAPGTTATPMRGSEEGAELTKPNSPCGRMADPREIGKLAVRMVSGEFDLVVGDTLYATGGEGIIQLDR